MHHALNQLSEVDPAWVRQWVPREWYDRYGLRAARGRLPKETGKREALALQIGADGYQLLEWVWGDERAPSPRILPALEGLRQIWLQHYYRCTVPGLEDLRWRTTDERPPAAVLMQSPYDLEARQRQETTEFEEKYALRSGVESSLSQGTRRFELRRSRYIGLARTHLQQLLNATAMHVARVMAW